MKGAGESRIATANDDNVRLRVTAKRAIVVRHGVRGRRPITGHIILAATRVIVAKGIVS